MDVLQVHEPEDVAGVRERLIQRFPTVPVSEIEELISRHAGNEDTCVAHILARADESGAADVSANYERVRSVLGACRWSLACSVAATCSSMTAWH